MGAPVSRPEHELPPDMNRSLPNVFLFGDSITETSFEQNGGTGLVFRDRWKRTANILNFGKGGQTTKSLKDYFDFEILHFSAPDLGFPSLRPPLFIAIWLGANDGALPDSPAHVPIDEYEVNLREYVDKIRDEKGWNETRVLLVTPPPIDSRRIHGDDIAACAEAQENKAYLDWKNRRDYAKRVLDVAASYNDRKIQGLDIWTLIVTSALHDLGMEWNEEQLPGCGLPDAKRFPGHHGKGYFTDGLHLGDKVGSNLFTVHTSCRL